MSGIIGNALTGGVPGAVSAVAPCQRSETAPLSLRSHRRLFAFGGQALPGISDWPSKRAICCFIMRTISRRSAPFDT